MFFLFLASSFANEDWTCLERNDICKHAIDGNCVEWDYGVCTNAVRTIKSYSAGCDLSSIISIINQEHCDIEVTCNDPISVVGTCYRGTGCYPGYYYDDCPANFDLKYTGNIQQKDCSEFGQTGTITLEEYEYGNFSGGSAMTLIGGGVTCQKYYSPRKAPSCAERLENGERPAECYVNECAGVENNPRCHRVDDLGTTDYGLETSKLEGFEDGHLYDVQVEKYECDSADVRNCKDKEYKMICPNGSETLCQSRKECLRWEKETINETTKKAYTLNRNYDTFTCIVEDGECDQYENNPDCVLVSSVISQEDSIMPCGSPETLFNKKWCKINSYGISPGDNTISNKSFGLSSNSCNSKDLEFLWTFTRTDGHRWTAFSWEITSNNINASGSKDTWNTTNEKIYETGAVSGDFCNDKWTMYVNNVHDPGKQSFSSGRIDFWAIYKLKTKRTYYCYTDYNRVSVPDSCSPTNEMLCLDYHVDLLNKNKATCRKSEIYFNCTDTITQDVCAEFQEEVICNNNSIPIPNIEMKNDDFTGFGESMGILGMLDDINSIWSGEYQYCSYGYFVNGFGGVYCNNCTGTGGFLCFQKKPEQQKAYEMNKKGLCHYLETDCTNEIDLGFDEICIEHTRKYCCYDSKLARVIVEQAYKQLGKSWSSGCNGLTVDDLNKLDFGAMDFSEIEADLKAKIDARTNKIGDSLKNRIKGYYTDFTDQMDQMGAHPQDPNNQ